MTCPACGGPVVQSRMGPRLTYCSRPCRLAAEGRAPVKDSGKRYAAAVDRDREGLAAAGLQGERTVAEWIARWAERPELFDDLVDALCGDAGPRAIDKRRRAA